MSLTARSASGVAWSMGAQVARQLLSIVSVSVLAHLIAPTEYGLIGMAATVTNILDNLKDLGTGYALVQRKEINPRMVSSVFWLNLLVGLSLTLTALAVSPMAASFFREPKLQPVLAVLSLNFLAYSLATVPNALLTRQMDFRPVAVAQVAGGVAGTSVGISMALQHYGVWSLVGAGLTSNLVTSLLTWWFSRWLPQLDVGLADLRGVARFGATLSAFNLVNYAARNADSILVGRFLGKGPLGYYQMGYSLLLYPLGMITNVVAQVLVPVFSKVQDDNARFRFNYCRVSALLAVLTAPLMLGLTAVAKPFVYALLGEKWAPVARLLLIFAPLGAAQSTVTLFGQIYLCKGRPEGLLRWALVSSTCYCAAFYFGLERGIEGVALAYACVWIVLVFPGMKLAFRLIDLRLRDYLAVLAPAFLSAAVMAGAVALLQIWLERQGVPWAAQLALCVLAGVAIYPALLWLWAKRLLGEVREVMTATGNEWLERAAAWLPAPKQDHFVSTR